MGEIFKLFIFLTMIDLFCLLDTSVILKFYFYFLGKNLKQVKIIPIKKKKHKRNFHQAPKSWTISQFPPLNLFTKNLREILGSGFLCALAMRNQAKQCPSLQTAASSHCPTGRPILLFMKAYKNYAEVRVQNSLNDRNISIVRV